MPQGKNWLLDVTDSAAEGQRGAGGWAPTRSEPGVARSPSLGLWLCPQLVHQGSFGTASIFTSWHRLREWEGGSGGHAVGMGVDGHNVIIGEISVEP